VRRKATAGRDEELLAFLIKRSAELKRDLADFACSPRLQRSMAAAMFGDPALAADKRYTDVLRGYLRSKTIAPLPLQRLAAAYPDTVDAVYRKVLRRRDFTWAEHGDALMRRRKAWYYQREPRPGVTVLSNRLVELASDGPR
jgi:hypothetical protein